MKPSWTLPEQTGAQSHEWPTVDVLLEFNGPQLAVVDGPEGRYISVATDEDGDVVRWVRSPISELELRALVSGEVSLRDAVLKEKVFVVDENSATGEILAEYLVDSNTLTDENLPEKSTYLQLHDTEVSDQPEITLSGVSVQESRIDFRPLSSFLREFQRLWNALYQVFTTEPTARGSVTREIQARARLQVASFQPGSVVVNVYNEDSELFELSHEKLKQLVGCGESREQLSQHFADMGPRVRATYLDLLSSLEKHGIEMSTRVGSSGYYIGPFAARRFKAAAADADVVTDLSKQHYSGYFIGFNIREAKFEFYESSEGETFRGSVSIASIGNEALERVVVGPAASYDISVIVVSRLTHDGTPEANYTLTGMETT